jgi:hypothetical protein
MTIKIQMLGCQNLLSCHLSLRATCPPAFAEALAQAGQGLAGGSAAISLAKFQITNSNIQINPNVKIPNPNRFKH